MNFFEKMMNPAWKTFPQEYKKVLAESIIRYFVNPLLEVENIRFVSFEQGGIKSETFLVDIDGSAFVFIPGQKEAILGWDNGTSGLNALEIADDRKEIYLSLEKGLEHWVQESHFAESLPFFSARLEKEEELDELINTKTSPLRTADIPPLLVEIVPSYLGMERKGSYSLVSGLFDGDWEWYRTLGNAIEENLFANHNGTESSFIDFPAFCYEPDNFFIIQDAELDDYSVYAAQNSSYRKTREKVEAVGMGFLSSDEWEYCCGGTSRRLFRWGNKIQRVLFEPGKSVLEEPNMFGLKIANIGWGPELVEDGQLVKGGWMNIQSPNILEKLLPYSSYYLNEKNSLKGKEEEELPAGYYCYRRSIRIEI